VSLDVQQIAPEAMALLRDYPWPGNIRELQSVLKQALLLAAGPILVPDFLPASLRKGGADRQAAALASLPQADSLDGFAAFAPHIEARLKEGAENLYEETLRRMERLLLTRVLQHTGGNQLQAAKILGITRGSLRTKIRELGITIARTISGSDESEE
jgi:two-component system, NtrC family, nitrogen regulation response regulator GlnG